MSYENRLTLAKVLYLAIQVKQHRIENKIVKKYKLLIDTFHFPNSSVSGNELPLISKNYVIPEAELQKTIDEKNCLLFNAFSLARPEIFRQYSQDDVEYLSIVSDAFFKFLEELNVMGKHRLYAGSPV